MKLDILSLSALTILSEAKRLIKENHDKDIVFTEIDLEDKKPFGILKDGLTAGIFQLGGSKALSRYCKELDIDDFKTIYHVTSIWRPGPLGAGMHEEFKERKLKRKKYTFPNPLLRSITKDTYGIIIYQEQVMLIMNKLAGMGWDICEKVRKVIGKSKGDAEFNKFKDMFIEGCVKNNIPKDLAIQLWDEMAKFGNYSFNMSHAVEYSIITYWDLYLKAYYPSEFYAASLTYGQDNKKEDIIKEARNMKLKVKLPELGYSDSMKWASKKGSLYAPFIEKTAEKLAIQKPKLQEGFFKALNGTGVAGTDKASKLLNLVKKYNDEGIGKEEVQELFSFKI
jgi:DNA polymerase-3 subunit alpha